jgi:hypothetical protein
MTKDDFIYALKTCGYIVHNGQVMYAEEDLIKRFDELSSVTSSEDVISREAVIRACMGMRRYTGIDETPYEYAENIIAELPSVTVRQTSNCNTCEYEEDRDSGECYECVKGIQDWYKPKQTVRQTGEWIDYSDEGFVECPICGHATNCEDNIDELHYCFWCGAEMVEPQERSDKE